MKQGGFDRSSGMEARREFGGKRSSVSGDEYWANETEHGCNLLLGSIMGASKAIIVQFNTYFCLWRLWFG